MNRLKATKIDRPLLVDSENDDDDDELIEYERKALIEQQDTGDDDIDLFSANPYEVRQRLARNNNELHELNTINSNNNNRQRDLISEPIVEYTYYDIKPGDTLHSICLRYSCPLAQVKRANGLMNDQEFYGLKRIKLPLGRLGLLGDVLSSPSHNGLTPGGSPAHDQATARQKIVISPGSALSVSSPHSARFKPLLSPGFSSDRINELNKFPRQNGLTTNSYNSAGGEFASTTVAYGNITKSHHSHSFSSLRDFGVTDTNQPPDQSIYHGHISTSSTRFQPQPEPVYVDTRQLQQQTFIKTHYDNDTENQTIVDYMPTTTTATDNVERVFEDLDYHVEKAKVAAESYDQRASELVNHIDDGSQPISLIGRGQRVSKIPELFFCNENFGLSYKKLLVFIFVVCLVVPLIYINQATIVTT